MRSNDPWPRYFVIHQSNGWAVLNDGKVFGGFDSENAAVQLAVDEACRRYSVIQGSPAAQIVIVNSESAREITIYPKSN
jgi:hypothetical protein